MNNIEKLQPIKLPITVIGSGVRLTIASLIMIAVFVIPMFFFYNEIETPSNTLPFVVFAAAVSLLGFFLIKPAVIEINSSSLKIKPTTMRWVKNRKIINRDVAEFDRIKVETIRGRGARLYIIKLFGKAGHSSISFAPPIDREDPKIPEENAQIFAARLAASLNLEIENNA